MINTYSQPDNKGHFGEFGGRYVAETLIPLIKQVEAAYLEAKQDKNYLEELDYYLTNYVGRPSPLYFAENLTKEVGAKKIYLKRDELNHTGAHKINHCVGQILLAKRMGKKRIIAETGAGQHGVATATVCALFGMECVIYMGAKDVARQEPNLFRMRLLGAEVRAVDNGSASLKDAMNEALRDWVSNIDDTFYLIGTAAGPHPYPMMVRDFQSIIGREAKRQFREQENNKTVLPDALIACIGGGSNALGLFTDFIGDDSVELFAVEAGGKGVDSGKTAASMARGSVGVLHGNKTLILQDESGYIQESSSISAGLDYPGIGPEHAYLKQIGRVNYVVCNDDEALQAFAALPKLEGIIPALEPSHAIGFVLNNKEIFAGKNIILNLCGRGDKDIFSAMGHLKGL